MSDSTPLKDLITPAGYKKLKAEAEELWNVERPRVTREVADAAALGDRSENAEYIYGKKRLREIDRRMRFLRKRLESVKIIDPKKQNPERINFAAEITLEDEDGELVKYRIVGTDECDASVGDISVLSPVARALMGKEVDDEVEVRRPRGDTVFTVLEIAYPDPS